MLLKGGHLDGTDLLYENGEVTWILGEKINNPNTHGTGCTLSSAIACNLAEGQSLKDAVKNAKAYLTGAISAKAAKDTAGVNVMTLKKYNKLQGVHLYKEGEFAKPHRYRTKTLPATGAVLSADDTAEQLTLE